MVKIRLRRTGKKKYATYRIVVAESTAPRDGRFIEVIGHYNPNTDPETVVYDRARALDWLAKGAQPTESVHRFFTRDGVLEILPRYRAGEDVESLLATLDAPSEEAAAEVAVEEPAESVEA